MAASYYRILVDEHGVDAQARCRTWGSGATRVYRSGFDWRYRQSRHIKTISRPILIAVGAAYHNGKDQTIIQRSGNIRSSSRCRSRVLHLVGSCICRFEVTSIAHADRRHKQANFSCSVIPSSFWSPLGCVYMDSIRSVCCLHLPHFSSVLPTSSL